MRAHGLFTPSTSACVWNSRSRANAIVKSHIVENTGNAPMPFELGGHEAYATCLLPGERMTDCFVRFEGLDTIEMFGMDEAGILTLPKIAVPL